jgi:DNA-damage-inducible protein D
MFKTKTCLGKSNRKEHVDNNIAVREMLTKRGIFPENLTAAEDVQKLQRKLKGEEKKNY